MLKTFLSFFLFFSLPLMIHAQKFDVDVQYLKKDISIKEAMELPDNAWKPVTSPIYEGLDNGVYWFKLELSFARENLIVSIPNSHVTRITLYHEGKPCTPLLNRRYKAFKIPSTEERASYYLQVNCIKEAVIPIEINTAEEDAYSYGTDNLILGGYYGMFIAVLLFNLFSFYTYRNPTYLYYILMLTLVNIPIAIRDGMLSLIVSPHLISEFIEPFAHILLGIACFLFTSSYLNVKHYLPKFKWWVLSAVALSFCLFILYLILQDFLVYALLEISVLIILTISWCAGILLFNKNVYARFYTIAYGLILFSSYDAYIAPHFGFKVMDLSLHQFRIGAAFEMIVFTFAISYQARKLASENREMRQKLIAYTNELKNLNKGVNEREATTMELMKQYGFTIKEIDILKDLANQKSNKEIADKHFISLNTVKFHIRNIFNKLEVNNRKEAGMKYLNFSQKESNEH